MINHKRLALIHIIKKELGLSDAEYRDTLEQIAGVRSAKDLDAAGFRTLVRHFVRSPKYYVHPGGMTLRQKMFMESMAHEYGWTFEHLRNFVRKYYHVPGVEYLTRAQASHAIESLKHVREHEA